MSEPADPLILNVDDSDAARYVKTRILQRPGWPVIEAADGESALRLARERQPALIVLDVRLPDIGGIEVARRLKGDPDTARIMVLQISSTLTGSADRVRGLEGGADYYLAAPAEPQELLACCRALLRIRHAEDAMQGATAAAQQGAQRLAQQNGRLQLLADATADLLSAASVDEMIGQLFERIAPAMGLDAYLHYEALPEGELRLTSSGGLTLPSPEAFDPPGSGQAVCGRAAQTARPISIHGIQSSDDPSLAFLKACGLDAYICAPMVVADDLIGTLGLGRRAGAPFNDDETAFVRTLCGYVAVTSERLVSTQRLARHAEMLAAADRSKDEFLAMLAHELRNPLAPLTNALKLLDRSVAVLDGDRLALEMARRQTRQLTRLVDDLLEVSRFTQGKIVVRPEPMSLTGAVFGAVESAQAQIDARDQVIRVEAPTLPVRISADPVRVAQILENLLTNASKYTPAGGQIWVELHEEDDRAVVRICDAGIGIEPVQLSSLFELFSQIDATLDRAQGGLGIGLALVRRLVELHGGSVEAFSEGKGRGAAFTVRLPKEGPLSAVR